MRRAWGLGCAAAVLLAACFSFGDLSGGMPDSGGDAAATACGPSQKVCVGECVEQSDPSVGCSGSCNACAAAPNAQTGCVLQNNVEVCGPGSCNPQYGDCDEQPGNGCETHTTTSANCGKCGLDCGGLYCEPTGTAYACSATCDAPNTVCGDGGSGECVLVASDNANCGQCGASCSVANGSGTCSAGKCVISCAPRYFLCGGVCVLPNDVQCGPSCSPCMAGSHCDSNSANPTYGDCVSGGISSCDADAGMCPTSSGAGCTTDLTQDPNCGFCNNDCAKAGKKCCLSTIAFDGGANYGCKPTAAVGCADGP